MLIKFPEFLIQMKDPRDLTPGEVSLFLDFLKKLVYELNIENAPEAERLLPVQLDKVNEVISELSNNFFPMSHSREPLNRLAIVEKGKIFELHDLAQALRNGSRQVSDLAEYTCERLERLSDDRVL